MIKYSDNEIKYISSNDEKLKLYIQKKGYLNIEEDTSDVFFIYCVTDYRSNAFK